MAAKSSLGRRARKVQPPHASADCYYNREEIARLLQAEERCDTVVKNLGLDDTLSSGMVARGSGDRGEGSERGWKGCLERRAGKAGFLVSMQMRGGGVQRWTLCC